MFVVSIHKGKFVVLSIDWNYQFITLFHRTDCFFVSSPFFCFLFNSEFVFGWRIN
eukprot:UN00658